MSKWLMISNAKLKKEVAALKAELEEMKAKLEQFQTASKSGDKYNDPKEGYC